MYMFLRLSLPLIIKVDDDANDDGQVGLLKSSTAT